MTEIRAIDRLVSWFSPERGLRRMVARRALAYYDAAKPSKQRKGRRAPGSGNVSTAHAGASLREQARYLEENHDLAAGILATLTQNVVGAHGIQAEPQPRRADGSIHEEFARQITDLMRDWNHRPEVTWQHDWASCQRLAAGAWLRDGEMFGQILEGTIPTLDHGTRLPFSIELMEADLCPIDLTQGAITQGVRRNAWGRPTGYVFYKGHPADITATSFATQTKEIPASRVLHPKLTHRIGQVRGVSIFASILQRLDDLKDYEESERIAAKVAASMAAVIVKGSPDLYPTEGSDVEPRDLRFRPGMIFDDLEPGESIETIDSKRPNSNLGKFRDDMLRACSSGTRANYSTISRNYDGSYSSQRQELVEGWGAYAVLSAEFTCMFVRPIYERAIAVALASGVLKLPVDVVPETADDALYIGPQMPWIDPAKEAKAFELLERAGHASGPEIIRRRGLNPFDLAEQEARWRETLRRKGLVVTSDPANDKGGEAAAEPDPEEEADDAQVRSRARR